MNIWDVLTGFCVGALFGVILEYLWERLKEDEEFYKKHVRG